MEVEQTNFVTHLTITEQLYYWLSKNPSVKILSNRFPVVITNYGRKSNERILCKLSKKWNFNVAFNRSCCHGNYVKFYLSIKVFRQYIFHLPSSAYELQPFLCHDLANHIYSQTAKTVFRATQSRSVLGSFGVMLMPWKVSFYGVRWALQYSVCRI